LGDVRTRLLLVLAVGGAVALAGCTTGPGGADAVECTGQGTNQTCEAPTLTVTSQGPTESQAQELAQALEIPPEDVVVGEDGGIRYVDRDGFMAVPTEEASLGVDTGSEDEGETQARALDREAVAELDPPTEQEARQRFESALDQVGLAEDVDVQASSGILGVVETGSGETEHHIDTTATGLVERNGLPLEGPGATIQVGFNGTGSPSLLLYEKRELSEGDTVEVVPPDDGDALCREALRDQASSGGPQEIEDVDSEMVYYMPPQDITTVETVVPHFRCEGSFADGDLRPTYVPATVDAPEVTVTASAEEVDGEVRVSADAQATGGQAPFDSYTWSSAETTLDPDTASGGDSVTYTVDAREEVDEDTVSVTVGDADGVTFSASETVDLPDSGSAGAAEGADVPTEVRLGGSSTVGHTDLGVGTEWVGETQGLGGSSGNAAGWVRESREAGVSLDFNWGDNAAWERDFKDPSQGGNDRAWVDDTDYTWYTGHADAKGWTFPGSKDDGKLRMGEARYGEKDLEWLTIAACGPLQDRSQDTIGDRWLQAFQGLHILTGYATLSSDNTREGQLLANLLHGDYGETDLSLSGSGLRVVQSWVYTAKDVQPDGKYTVATMGPIGQNDVWNWHDNFWGEGSVGPDINPGERIGYWWYRTST
jgi:hypothetical protein